MLNRIIIMGRLGRDPEVRYTQAGRPVPGWTAKKQVRVHGMTSYTVIQCPMYLEDEERSVEA